MKKILVILAIVILAAIGVYVSMQNSGNNGDVPQEEQTATTTDDQSTSTDVTVPDGDDTDQNGDDQQTQDDSETVIGTSAGGHDITAYHYGDGTTNLLFVGGIHGGYSWNTVLVSYELMDWLEQNPNVIPSNVRVTVIPTLNPDGVNNVVGTTDRFTAADVPSSQQETIPGRFNENNVDLNRNFDCNWESTGVWQDRQVDGGDEPFSEPESQAFRDYVNQNSPDGVVFYYSAAGGVFSSNCYEGVLDQTATLTNVYADASGYQAYEEFNFYRITGDAVNWLAKENIPAISVLLSNHQDTEWDKNKAGIEAVFDHYSN